MSEPVELPREIVDIVEAAVCLVWSVDAEDADWYVPMEWLCEAVHAYCKEDADAVAETA